MNAYRHTLITASPMAELNALPEPEGFMRMVDALASEGPEARAFRELVQNNAEWFADVRRDRLAREAEERANG